MSMFPWAISCAIILLSLSTASAEPSRPAPECTVPKKLTRFEVTLPNTARAVRTAKPLVIVAIGSSSTEGIGASDRARAYPAVLAGELGRHWPQIAVTVINKGVRGEIASQMLARFDRDVLPHHPQLVIWQTGSNQTLRSDSIETYTDSIRDGIGRLKAASADIVLMDPQYAPRVLARPKHLMVLNSIRTVATEMNVAVFQRFAVMQHWIASGQYTFQEIISSDDLHMNDVSYNCIARLLAGSIEDAAESDTDNHVARSIFDQAKHQNPASVSRSNHEP
jgi:acyl-CoA thioesterase-1